MKRTQPPSNKPDLEQIVYGALRSLGWVVPTTEEDVAASESLASEGEIVLPEALRNPFAALDERNVREERRRHAVTPDAGELADALARAAREGKGHVSPEAEALMKRDRDEAEAIKLDKDDD